MQASVKIALMNLRVHMDEMQHKHEELECKYEQTRVKLIEIQKGSESTEQWEEKDYFKGLGETADVQEALHFTEGANIKNKNLTLGQVEKAVKSMLAKRKKEEEVALAKGLTAERPDIWTDLHKYALSNNKSSVARAEWAYSFCDSLKRFSRDNLLCRVFNQMLQGRACPAVYYEMISIPDLIFERALIRDKEQRTNGRMPRKMFQSLVENFFKPIVNGGSGHAKDKIIMEELFRRLKNDEMAGTWGVKPKEIEIKKLFMETKEGERSYFVLGLMEQFLDDRGLYLMDLVLYIQRRRNPNAQVCVWIYVKGLCLCLHPAAVFVPANACKVQNSLQSFGRMQITLILSCSSLLPPCPFPSFSYSNDFDSLPQHLTSCCLSRLFFLCNTRTASELKLTNEHRKPLPRS